jgi:hypothetical protein
VWTNDTVDGSFGITSAIQLTDIEPHSGHVFNTVAVPPDQVVTSFSSKSELGLHVTKDASGSSHLVFVAYAGAGVGQIDVSNADAVPGQDPTNPCTFAFGTDHAFARTIVSMDAQGTFAYTPTIDYGGNNGRSALLGSNGLYYAVGNANNGNASTFGPNGTNPDVTATTGLEVVIPINGATSNVAIPAGNSAEVDPLIQYKFGSKPDKAGKDNNYRGVTEYNGALYFTKGSGGNGIDTVYTEGSGNALDLSSHAGLEKWSLVGGTWQLDYVLTNGLTGVVDTGLTGPDGQYPDVRPVRGGGGFDDGCGAATPKVSPLGQKP